MYGRYYVDDDIAGEIEKLIRQVDEKMREAENIHLQAGDILRQRWLRLLQPIIMTCVADGRDGDSLALTVSSLSLMSEVNQP